MSAEIKFEIFLSGVIIEIFASGASEFGGSGLFLPIEGDGGGGRFTAVGGGGVVAAVVEERGASGTGGGAEVEIGEALRTGGSGDVGGRAGAVEIKFVCGDGEGVYDVQLHC